MGSLKDKRMQSEDPAEAQMWWPYIQPTGEEYDGFWGKNGYYAFEVGYLRQDHGKLVEKRVISSHSDACYNLFKDLGDSLSFDVIEGMHIRFHAECPLKWDEETIPMSTVRLRRGVPKV